jgi:hypothetical protein
MINVITKASQRGRRRRLPTLDFGCSGHLGASGRCAGTAGWPAGGVKTGSPGSVRWFAAF